MSADNSNIINRNPALESFGSPDRTTPRWGETSFLGGWSPKNKVGVFVHTGRCQQDLDLWWAHVAAYLPDGNLAVGYSWGRSPDDAATGGGNMELRVVEPLKGWSASYDGAGELTTIADLAAGTVGSGPARPLRWNLDLVGATPTWNMLNRSSEGGADDWASEMHTQQVFKGTGTISYDNVDYEFDGVCYNDHSRGPRTLEAFAGDISFIAAFEDFSIHGIKVWDADDNTKLDAGVLFRGEEAIPVRVRHTTQTDMMANPRTIDVKIVDLDENELLTMTAEVLMAMPITITDKNENLNGIAWDVPGDPLLFVESTVRLTTSDGKVGYGNVERSMRRSKAVKEAEPE